jgi:MoaA/NifB/PqqE/SkfB family radical SAM enzyme
MKTADSATHPCFSPEAAHRYARLHLPVAPSCNIGCSYCNRKYDCVNESRPGVTSRVLNPAEALERFRRMRGIFPNLKIVGIAGPGDALANPSETFETVGLIRAEDRDVDFCLSTNGVALPTWLPTIRAVGVKYVTVTVNSRRLDVARTLYAWAQEGKRRLEGTRAAEFVMARQEEALDVLKESRIRVKVNVVYIPGVNDAEIEPIVRFVKDKGVEIVNVMPFIPTPGTYFENFPMVGREALADVRRRMAAILPQMRHCAQCRADAVGNVLNERPVFVENGTVLPLPPPACAERDGDFTGGRTFRFAVASRGGYLVDLHFGHAEEMLIYDASGSSIRFTERRAVGRYCPGKEGCGDPRARMERMLSILSDCHAVLALRIGDEPRRKLAEKGIRVVMTCNRIEEAIRENYGILRRSGPSGASKGDPPEAVKETGT